jgi:hypothetical protein
MAISEKRLTTYIDNKINELWKDQADSLDYDQYNIAIEQLQNIREVFLGDRLEHIEDDLLDEEDENED